MGWPRQQQSSDVCVACEEAKAAPKPTSTAHGACAEQYDIVDACMKREDRKSVKECAREWKAFRECHAAAARRR